MTDDDEAKQLLTRLLDTMSDKWWLEPYFPALRHALVALSDREKLVEAAYSVLPSGEQYDTHWERILREMRVAARRHMEGRE